MKPDGQERPVFFWPNLLHDLRTFGVRTALYNAWDVLCFVLWGEGAEEETEEKGRSKTMAKMSKPAMPKGMPPKGMPPKGMHMMGGKMMSDAEMQKMHGSPSAKKGKK